MTDKPLLVAPALSVVVAEMGRRPPWQHGWPLRVPPDLFAAAREEMRAILRKRGFGLARSKAVNADNFLIHGTPIVSNG